METAEVEMTKDTSKLAIWEALGKTDPSQTKQFKRAGGFTGTAIRPMWANKRMTEYFGPCGIGWGMDKPEFTLVEAAGEILVFCTVSLWYIHLQRIVENELPTGGFYQSRHTVFGQGGDKVVSQVFLKDAKGQRIVDAEKGGYKTYPQTDDEAYKKAFTDAIGNAMKFVGVGADVHMGLFDDSKYVQEVREDFEEQKKAEVVAEVERQKGSQAPQDAPQAILPPEPTSSFNKASGLLLGRIVDVAKKSAKNGRDYLILQFDVELEKGKKPIAFYWHETHRDALLAAKGKMIKALVEFDGKGFRVESVTEIDYHKLEAESVPPVAGIHVVGPEMQARLLASVFEMTEQDLADNLRLCKGSWQGVLEFLQREQARREVTA